MSKTSGYHKESEISYTILKSHRPLHNHYYIFACTLYHTAQNFDGGNIDEFDEFVAICKILAVCM